MPNRRKFTDTALLAAVADSKTLWEVVQRVGLSGSSGYASVRVHCARLSICLEHLHVRGKGLRYPARRRQTLDRWLVNDGAIDSWTLRQALFEFGVKLRKCERCGLVAWMGEPIPLALHHRDGDHDNNRLGNLQILCFNCHGLTANWGNKRRGPVVE